MKLSSYLSWIRSGQALALMRISKSSRELYRLCFLARAAEIGLLASLASKPKSFAELIEGMHCDDEGKNALAAFVQIGISLGEIGRKSGQYKLKGRLAKALARSELDSVCALTEEITGLHVPYLMSAPGSEENRKRLANITDEFSTVVARSSRVLEAILNEVTDDLVPPSGTFHLMEIGCGSGVYIFRALQRNPLLKAVGIEVQTEVGMNVRAKAEECGLSDRVDIIVADVMSLEDPGTFDLITLHNNIYYFSEAERIRLYSKLLSWLRPGGKVAISSTCLGASLLSSLGTLWTSMTEGAGPLPDPNKFCRQLQEAGFINVRCNQPVSFGSYSVFIGIKPD